MSNVFTQLGDLELLGAIQAVPVPVHMRLFQNNHTPGVTDVIGDYTVATFSGYPGDVSPTWGTPFTNGDGKAETDAGTTTYTHNGGGTSNTIYGAYFVTAGGVLVYADKFAAPIVMASNGDTFPYTPRMTLVNG
jgi:hypothetical protein